jgi:DNA-binding CsgD family transcriptional regulator
MALLQDVLLAMVPDGTSFVAIDDYSGVTGASLNARRYIIQALRRQEQLALYVVFGPSTIFRLGIEVSRRLHVFPFQVAIAGDYAEAIVLATERAANLDGAQIGSPALGIDGTRGDVILSPGTGRADDGDEPLASYAAELLEYVGSIGLETYGVPPTYRKVPFNHPFRPVHDALAILRDDMQAILRRHRKARENLERREADLAAQKTMLNETHTTLNILLASQREERQRYENRIRDRFNALLQPLVEGFEKTPQTPRQRALIRLLKNVISHMGAPLPREKELRAPFTARERMIAHLLTIGQKPREIADTLGLSPRTIENHCQRMRAKLGLKGPSPALGEWLVRKDLHGLESAGN